MLQSVEMLLCWLQMLLVSHLFKYLDDASRSIFWIIQIQNPLIIQRCVWTFNIILSTNTIWRPCTGFWEKHTESMWAWWLPSWSFDQARETPIHHISSQKNTKFYLVQVLWRSARGYECLKLGIWPSQGKISWEIVKANIYWKCTINCCSKYLDVFFFSLQP